MRQELTIFMLWPNGSVIDYGPASNLDVFVNTHRSADWAGANHYFLAGVELKPVEVVE